MKCLEILLSDPNLVPVVIGQILTPYMARPIKGSTSGTLRIVSACFSQSVFREKLTLRWDHPVLLH